MSRSIWKGPFFSNNLSFDDSSERKQNKIKEIWSRNSTILPQFIGKKVKIYNGNSYYLRQIEEEMVGHKWGEFSSTKKKTKHKSKKKQQSRKK